MQALEAMLSLLAFGAISLPLICGMEDQRQLDDSLYRLQLAEDAWRVLYLRGDFRDFGDSSRAAVESDLVALGDETGLCFFLKGVEITNCRSGELRWMTASLRRTAVYGGKPRAFAFSVGR